MSGEKGGAKADTLVKAILFLFIALLSFSVGTFVGKQVSDSENRRASLEGEGHGDRMPASNGEEHGAADSEGSKDKISDKEVEALTEEFVNREKGGAESAHGEKAETEHAAKEPEHGEKKVDESGYKSFSREKGKTAAGAHAKPEAEHAAVAPAAHASTAHAAAAAHAPAAEKPATTEKPTASDKHAADATAKAAAKLAAGKAPTDGAKEERKPASALPSVASSSVGKYTVQIASYVEENEAKTRAADLKGKGWNAFYLPANVKGKTYFRVLVGLFNSSDSAKEYRAKYMKDTNSKDALVQKIVE